MKTVIVECFVTESVKDQVVQKVKDLSIQSRKEVGNISYNLYYNHQSQKLILISTWVNEESFRDHVKSLHFLETFLQVKSYIDNHEITIYEPVEICNTDNMIFKRRSIQEFIKEQEVEHYKIEMILRAAMQAPVASEERPWEFLIIDKPDVITKLSLLNEDYKKAETAPLLIVTLANVKDKTDTERVTYPIELAAVTQNILLEATELGLGSLWLMSYPNEEYMKKVQEFFNLENYIRPFSIIALGYSKEANYYVDKYDESKIHYNKY